MSVHRVFFWCPPMTSTNRPMPLIDVDDRKRFISRSTFCRELYNIHRSYLVCLFFFGAEVKVVDEGRPFVHPVFLESSRPSEFLTTVFGNLFFLLIWRIIVTRSIC